jgi:nicotinate-nucleotide adenylyltransferase
MSLRIGLYFGSFNPIHKGHLQVASYLQEQAPFDFIWFVPSPLNPHKSEETLIPALLRLKWVEQTVQRMDKFECKDDEFDLGLPSYTYKSVLHFKEKYPNYQFFIIMGADNIYSFHTWNHAEHLAQIAPLHVYARPGYPSPADPLPFNALWYDAPLIDISATQIRDALKKGMEVKDWVPSEIEKELREFYR